MMTDSLKTDSLGQAAAAPAGHNFTGDLQFWRLTAMVIVIAIGITFILVVIKLLLDHRLKSRMVEKDVPEERIRLILGSGQQVLKQALLKWFLIFAGIAAGLFIVSAVQPDEAAALAIISAGIAASFGLYYLIKKDK